MTRAGGLPPARTVGGMSLRLSGRPLPVVGKARMYVCGITPYDTTHLGHASTFVWADVVARVLRHGGVEVEVSRNITDVDDDMLEQARQRGTQWRSLAAQQTYRFEDDMRRLGVVHPTHEPQSHNYVDEVISLGQALVEAGVAYERNGAVYFRGAGVPERAGLGRQEALDRLAEHGGYAGDGGADERDDALDVPVWQRSAADEPCWPSPWGDGRPGWHAECAAMALATLGCGIDVHGGGADLAFPHHAYEAAQAEAATGVRPFARAWLHAGTVRIGGEKMAKSKGNLVFVHHLLESWPAEAVRLLILDRPWHEAWDYDEAALGAAADRLDYLRGQAGRPVSDDRVEQEAMAALLDDLDVSRALAVAEEQGGAPLKAVGSVLGIF